jgi:hypothetical protein
MTSVSKKPAMARRRWPGISRHRRVLSTDGTGADAGATAVVLVLLCSRPRDLSTFNDGPDFERLRNLKPFGPQEYRLQMDAEACCMRVMIRTGKPLGAVTGEDLLAYAGRRI